MERHLTCTLSGPECKDIDMYPLLSSSRRALLALLATKELETERQQPDHLHREYSSCSLEHYRQYRSSSLPAEHRLMENLKRSNRKTATARHTPLIKHEQQTAEITPLPPPVTQPTPTHLNKTMKYTTYSGNSWNRSIPHLLAPRTHAHETNLDASYQTPVPTWPFWNKDYGDISPPPGRRSRHRK